MATVSALPRSWGAPTLRRQCYPRVRADGLKRRVEAKPAGEPALIPVLIDQPTADWFGQVKLELNAQRNRHHEGSCDAVCRFASPSVGDLFSASRADAALDGLLGGVQQLGELFPGVHPELAV